MKNRSEAYPIRDITFEGIDFHNTDMGKGGLWNVLDSTKDGSNIWIDKDGKVMEEGVAVYNKELLPGIFVVAFDTEEARNFQLKANESLEGKDTGKYTVPDITTFFEIEKDGKKLYCYLVDRLDMWKHKKEMLMGEMDNISIDGVIIYPSGFIQTREKIETVKDEVNGTISTPNRQYTK